VIGATGRLYASLLLVALAGAPLACAGAQSPDPGARIYMEGVLPDGTPLRGVRDAGVVVEGREAACVHCHRRSGLGSVEGRTTVPPISGEFLFHPRAKTAEDLNLPFVEGARPDRDPYTPETLATAIRSGHSVEGNTLSYLMPRYALDDAQIAALTAYLNTLSTGPEPGVANAVLHLATIVTPDADPLKRQGMLDVMTRYFEDKNAAARVVTPRMRSTHKMMWRVTSRWQLHVWELTGPASTWQAQLQAKLKAEPVFAVLSGVGGSNWAPVHRFCEQEHLPCLFPNVDAPVVDDGAYYPMYLSKGVYLEAGILAHELAVGTPARRVVQVYRAGDAGERGAEALDAQLRERGVTSLRRALPARTGKADLAGALRDLAPDDALVLWLRPADVRALAAVPVRTKQVWMSGLLAEPDDALPPDAWRAVAHLTYPYDLPERRVVRVDYARGWFRIKKIPVVAARTQVDTFLVCGLLSETLNHMVDTFLRDYLIERIEMMLEHRVLTGYYPRLTLGPGQRFASKGGYVVHYAPATGAQPIADGDWIVP